MKGFGENIKPINKKLNDKKIHLYKEKIVDQAIKLHVHGDIHEALKYYQYCIEKNFNDHRIYFNYGIISKESGKLKEAEIAFLGQLK